MQCDGGSYSEPVMHLNIYKKWMSMTPAEQMVWGLQANVSHARVQAFVSSVNILSLAVDKAKGAERGNLLLSSALQVGTVITPQKLNIYKLMLTWMSYGNVIRQSTLVEQPPEATKLPTHKQTLSGVKQGIPISDDLLDNLLPPYHELSMTKKTYRESMEPQIIPWEKSTKGALITLVIPK